MRARITIDCELTDDVQIELNDNDNKRAKRNRRLPLVQGPQGLAEGNRQMLNNGFKMEVESLITKDISYVTEEYVPERLKKKDWLD